jgi:hypothetical protein
LADPALIEACKALHPHWTTYVQALGTPIVAVIAAGFAGMIAYRQWRTARDKLKLDLFGRRHAVYAALVAYFQEVTSVTRPSSGDLPQMKPEIDSGQWLFGPDVADFLRKVNGRHYVVVFAKVKAGFPKRDINAAAAEKEDIEYAS